MAVDPKSSPMLATTMDSMWCGDDTKGEFTVPLPEPSLYLELSSTLQMCLMVAALSDA
jgi:hypothetical protein